jgi:hypothetical protein
MLPRTRNGEGLRRVFAQRYRMNAPHDNPATSTVAVPELGIGIVGYGFIGKIHAFAHRSLPLFYDPLPARTRLIGVCTTSEASGQKAVEQAGFQFATTDPADLLARGDIHAIHCCTPNDAHRDLIVAALHAGKHVYCDKPLARTLREAEEIASLARTRPDLVCRMTVQLSFRAGDPARQGVGGRGLFGTGIPVPRRVSSRRLPGPRSAPAPGACR